MPFDKHQNNPSPVEFQRFPVVFMTHRFAIVLWMLLGLSSVRADVKLPAILGDHAVLQQGQRLPIWGQADPGEEVTLSLAGQEVSTTADSSGQWSVQLKPLKMDSTPQEMTVRGKNTLVVRDLLVGDVWICSGQSNMDFRMNRAHNAVEAIPQANYPQIRLFDVKKKIAFTPQKDCDGEWLVCTPATVRRFSAVAYFFGREIHEAEKIPVGLVNAAWGGSLGETWTSLEALESNPALTAYADHFKQTRDHLARLKAEYAQKILPDWQKKYDAWKAQYGAEEIKPGDPTAPSTTVPPQPPAPKKPLAPDEDQHLPTVLYNGMLAPLFSCAMKGVVWYQGEQNADNESTARLYATLLSTLIQDWRLKWNQGDFPFIIVQLPGFGPHESWVYLRDSQRKNLSLPNTGMAVTIDLGEEKDVHPRNKQDVGHRVALVARHLVYGEKLVYTGPCYRALQEEKNKIRVLFDQAGSGLKIGSAPSLRLNVPPEAPLDHVEGFEIAAADGRFVPATAQISENNSVLVWNEAIAKPTAIRYGWRAFPRANLYNKENLPASPFSTLEPVYASLPK